MLPETLPETPGLSVGARYIAGVADIDITAELEFHSRHGKKATIAAVTPPGRFGALEIEGEAVRSFKEKPSGDHSVINGGFFVLNPSVIDLIPSAATFWEKGPLEALAATGELAVWRHTGFWQPMDTLREKQLLEELWAKGAPWKSW